MNNAKWSVVEKPRRRFTMQSNGRVEMGERGMDAKKRAAIKSVCIDYVYCAPGKCAHRKCGKKHSSKRPFSITRRTGIAAYCYKGEEKGEERNRGFAEVAR